MLSSKKSNRHKNKTLFIIPVIAFLVLTLIKPVHAFDYLVYNDDTYHLDFLFLKLEGITNSENNSTYFKAIMTIDLENDSYIIKFPYIQVQPFDSFELPTKNYTYIFDGVVPEIIKVSQRTSANKTYDIYFYYDGFANFIQFKQPADGNQQIVKNLFYDGLGRIASEHNPYFDALSTGLSTPSTTVNKTNYTFDALGRVIFLKNTDGTNKTILFNHRLITAFYENSHRKQYVLDGYDRISNVLEFNNNPILDAVLNVTSEEVYNTTYEYDASDNLIKITDALGNKFTFGYDSLGRRIALSDPDLGNWSYEYDLVGNLITQRQNGGGNLVTGDGYYREYDGLNQLIRIRNGSSVTSPVVEEYSYDPFGQRIKITRNDTDNTTIYTPFKELMRIRNSSGSFDFTYVYQEGMLVARVNPDGTKYFYHPDHLGSTTLITDSSGNVVENTYYSPYGELLSGGSADVKLYTGQMKDNVLCQYYYGKRYFSPCNAQFTQPDTLIQRIYNPQSLNRYAYTLNNPYRYTDSTGNYIESAIDVAFISMDIADIQSDPTNLWNYAALVADIGGLVLPGATGGRVVVKGAEFLSKGDKAIDVAKLEEKIQNVANKLGKVSDAPSGTRKHSEAFRRLEGTPNLQVDVFSQGGKVVPAHSPNSKGFDILITPQDLSKPGTKIDQSQIVGRVDLKFGKNTQISTKQQRGYAKETGGRAISISPEPSIADKIWGGIVNWWDNLWK